MKSDLHVLVADHALPVEKIRDLKRRADFVVGAAKHRIAKTRQLSQVL